MPFIFKKTKIKDVILIQSKIFKDKRGLFLETYKYSNFSKNGIKEKFVQENYSQSKKGVLRGLHYQKNPKAQAKIITCLKGKIFDVAVDIRKGSPNYGQWISIILSEKNKYQLYIPIGFAHGFLVLSKSAQVLYRCSKEYAPEYERGIIYNDPKLKIKWPIKNPILSLKDQNWPTLEKADNNFKYKK